MRIEWDQAKNATNREKHGLGFEAMERFDWDFAALLDTKTLDTKTLDGEARELWAGPADSLLVAVVVAEREGEDEIVLRIISLRRATNAEKALWRQEFHHGQ